MFVRLSDRAAPPSVTIEYGRVNCPYHGCHPSRCLPLSPHPWGQLGKEHSIVMANRDTVSTLSPHTCGPLPCLTDTADHAPIVVLESGALLQYLVE
jgi:hypothetical protein